ncbi:hypothetical protein HPG69_017544 [Diceros bicornis minor]|uniref:Cystatin domain-containing protein n=1 Tax=Diceros bicornis minor TaxID=77932 RepID=A0A7J7EKK4_DICBM|nr:hypothetical protein HPG69_017544 [Diceros bicornis minor]
MRVQEVSATEVNVTIMMPFVIHKYNRESNNYNFLAVLVLELQKQIANHMEYHIYTEMWKESFTSKSSATSQCLLLWFEKYKILNKNCTTNG